MTYQLNMAISDELAAEVREYAEYWDLKIAPAVRILLRAALYEHQDRKPERPSDGAGLLRDQLDLDDGVGA